jgi:hypothetical protein
MNSVNRLFRVAGWPAIRSRRCIEGVDDRQRVVVVVKEAAGAQAALYAWLPPEDALAETAGGGAHSRIDGCPFGWALWADLVISRYILTI